MSGRGQLAILKKIIFNLCNVARKYKINFRLTDKFANELKKYQLVCFYCGTTLDDITVNKKCKGNKNPPNKGCKLRKKNLS
jgi:hypothetical protein